MPFCDLIKSFFIKPQKHVTKVPSYVVKHSESKYFSIYNATERSDFETTTIVLENSHQYEVKLFQFKQSTTGLGITNEIFVSFYCKNIVNALIRLSILKTNGEKCYTKGILINSKITF